MASAALTFLDTVARSGRESTPATALAELAGHSLTFRVLGCSTAAIRPRW
jgi:hypothetical protein